MARRPGTRTVAAAPQQPAEPAAESQFVSQLAEFAETGSVAGADELPDFLTGPVAPHEPDPEPVHEERWDKPFASGKAPSDQVMSHHGRPADQPPTNLPHGAMRRGRGSRSVR